MTTLKIMLAAAALSAATATAAFAQAAIQEPGAYAFYHPDAGLNLRSARPAADAMAAYRPGFDQDRGAPHRTRHLRSGSVDR